MLVRQLVQQSGRALRPLCPQGRGTKHYGLIVVGHSLGAGTAAILSFLLRPQYPTLKCFAYSPPGGLLR